MSAHRNNVTSIRARFPRILIQYRQEFFSVLSSARAVNLTSRAPGLNTDNIARCRENRARRKKPRDFSDTSDVATVAVLAGDRCFFLRHMV